MATTLETPTNRACRLALEIWGWPLDLPLSNHLRTWALQGMMRTDLDLGCIRGRRPQEAMANLSDAHAAFARIDLNRVHKSWWVQVLKSESPAAQRIVTARAPQAIQPYLMEKLGLTAADLKPDATPEPQIVDCVLSLWSSKFVVGPAPDLLDPPAVQVIARSDTARLKRLTRRVGLAKLSQIDLAPDFLLKRDLSIHKRLKIVLSKPKPAQREQAKRDLERITKAGGPLPDGLAAVTLGRLLAEAEPRRALWTFQHLPLRLAMAMKEEMDSANRHGRPQALLEWELSLLQAAEQELDAESDR